MHKLTALDANEGDSFGGALAIDGNIAVIGASGAGPGVKRGSAYVFDITTGEQLYKLTSPDSQEFDFFGRSVSVSDGIALVGAPEWKGYYDGRGAGYVDVFDVDTGQWLRKLTIAEGDHNNGFGVTTWLDGDLAIVGSNITNEDGRQGALYFFDVNTGDQLYKHTEPYYHEYELFGFSFARDGGATAVAALVYGENNAIFSAVHVYQDIPEPGTAVTAGIIVLGLMPLRRMRSERGKFDDQ